MLEFMYDIQAREDINLVCTLHFLELKVANPLTDTIKNAFSNETFMQFLFLSQRPFYFVLAICSR